MKIHLNLAALVLLSVISLTAVRAENAPVYELRVYSTHPGKMPDLLTRFREHTCALFARHGMENVGYWLPLEPKDGDTLYYLLKHPSREAAKTAWKAFGADAEWQAARKTSEANGPIVARIESVFLSPTDYSPAIPAMVGPHVFELRTYTTNDGKLETLDTRFREHTMALFAKHGIINLPYWHVADADKGAGKTLVYLLAYPSREAASQSWADFQADPDWMKVRTASEQAGRILIQGGIKSVYLTPTDFSALK